jgi:predicted ATP-binding protein involved in virulence
LLFRMEIKSLFGRFDYNINLKESGVTIITGPNGYGKSTILKCIEAISEEDIIFFLKLDFKRIVFIFEDSNKNFTIFKNENGLSVNDIFIPKEIINNDNLEIRVPHIARYGKDRWFNKRTGEIIDSFEYGYQRALLLQNSDKNDLETEDFKKITEYLKVFKENIGPIYFIKEQRLITEKKKGRSEQEIINVIEELPNKFKSLIRDVSNNYSAIANKLDSSYPNRLFNTEVGITEEEYRMKMDEMATKFEKLTKYDISEMQISTDVVFKNEHAKALKIYFDDFNEKYKVYEDFITKLDLFTDIVNDRLSFKKIKISRDNGIIVIDKDFKDRTIELHQLSSGEKQEIVLFYELIFEATNDVFLLIDEPEISLHIVWQKMFMDDLLKTVKYKGLNVIVATHSPQIINNHWDKQIDLGELYGDQLHKS